MQHKFAQKNNVTWFKCDVSRENREELNGHKGAVIWFTGLSASGKSTIASIVEKELHCRGCSTYVIDGDNVRHGLCADLTFCSIDRVENIRRVGELVRLFVDAGIIVLAAFVSPYRDDRQRLRALLDEGQFFEIYVDCPPEVCAHRDQKGLYAKAKAGIIGDFTGISAPYERPENPDLTIRSDRSNALQAAQQIIGLVEKSGVLLRPRI